MNWWDERAFPMRRDSTFRAGRQSKGGLCNNDVIVIIFGRTDVSCVQRAIPGSLAFAPMTSHRYQDRLEAPSPMERLRRPSIKRVDGAVPPPEHGSWRNRRHSEDVS